MRGVLSIHWSLFSFVHSVTVSDSPVVLIHSASQNVMKSNVPQRDHSPSSPLTQRNRRLTVFKSTQRTSRCHFEKDVPGTMIVIGDFT